MALQQKSYRIDAYLDHHLHKRLMKEVTNRRSSVSRCIAELLAEYFDLMEEMATAMSGNGKAGDAKTGKIIHTLLAETEARIAASIERQARRISAVQDDVQILNAMVDRLHLNYMLHTPEVAEEWKNGALTSANIRHEKWRKAVAVLLREG